MLNIRNGNTDINVPDVLVQSRGHRLQPNCSFASS